MRKPHHISFPAGDKPLLSEVRLDCDQLQGWNGWSSESKQYMASCGKSVHLSATVREYMAGMERLYEWVFEQFEALHAKDIDATNALVEQFNLTLSGGVTDGRDWYQRAARMQQN